MDGRIGVLSLRAAACRAAGKKAGSLARHGTRERDTSATPRGAAPPPRPGQGLARASRTARRTVPGGSHLTELSCAFYSSAQQLDACKQRSPVLARAPTCSPYPTPDENCLSFFHRTKDLSYATCYIAAYWLGRGGRSKKLGEFVRSIRLRARPSTSLAPGLARRRPIGQCFWSK